MPPTPTIELHVQTWAGGTKAAVVSGDGCAAMEAGAPLRDRSETGTAKACAAWVEAEVAEYRRLWPGVKVRRWVEGQEFKRVEAGR